MGTTVRFGSSIVRLDDHTIDETLFFRSARGTFANPMAALCATAHRLVVDAAMSAEAMRIGNLRLDEKERHRSMHRQTSRNRLAQARGALGELAFVAWAREAGFDVVAPCFDDEPGRCDLELNGVPFEIATAQFSHRCQTGVCVQPEKAAAAARRGAAGFLFATIDESSWPVSRVLLTGGASMARVLRAPRRMTSVNGYEPVLNHVLHPMEVKPLQKFFTEMAEHTVQ